MSKPLDPQLIIHTVCKALNLPELKKKTRRAEYVHARYIAIKLLLSHTFLKYSEIGELLGMDTTAVYWGEKRISQLLKKQHEVSETKWLTVKKAIQVL